MVTAAVQPQPQQNQGPVDVNETATSNQQAEQQETNHVYKCTAVVVCFQYLNLSIITNYLHLLIRLWVNC